LITKYVPSEFLEQTRAGFLRFGTLAEYRKTETSGEARFKDDTEGTWRFDPPEKLDNYSGPITDLISSTNTTFDGPGALVSLSTPAHILCTSAGTYDAAVLSAFRENGNPTLSSYVVFDHRRLSHAIMHMLRKICPSEGLAA
jgi:hypothetical protein